MTLIRFCLFYTVAVIQGDPQTVWGTVILAWNKTERRGDTEWQSERTRGNCRTTCAERFVLN